MDIEWGRSGFDMDLSVLKNDLEGFDLFLFIGD
jgi:hypothetical protein